MRCSSASFAFDATVFAAASARCDSSEKSIPTSTMALASGVPSKNVPICSSYPAMATALARALVALPSGLRCIISLQDSCLSNPRLGARPQGFPRGGGRLLTQNLHLSARCSHEASRAGSALHRQGRAQPASAVHQKFGHVCECRRVRRRRRRGGGTPFRTCSGGRGGGAPDNRES